MEIQIRGLQNLGVKLNSYGGLLFPLLIKLIPDSVALDFNKTHEKNDAWDVTELLKFFKKEIETRERTFLFREMGENKNQNETNMGTANQKHSPSNWHAKNNKFQNYKKRQESIPSATALSAIKEENCLFCNSAHSSESCVISLSDKIKSLKLNGRCFLCLRKNHVIKDCLRSLRCSKCHRRHNVLICSAENPIEEAHTSQPLETVVNSVSEREAGVILQTVKADIENKQTFRRRIRMLLDLGAQKTFIKRSLSEQMKLPVIGSEAITIYAFGTAEPQNEIRKKVRFVLSSPFDSREKVNIEALETDIISGTSVEAPKREIIEICKGKGIKLSDNSFNKNRDEEFSLLVGADFYWQIVSGKICRISNALVAVETKFGWAVSGTEKYQNSYSTNVLQNLIHVNKEPEIDSISELMRHLWQLEALGVDNKSDENHKLEDNVVYKQFRDSITWEDNRYTVSLPWNKNADKLSNNYDVAKKRFQSLWRKFERNSEFHDRYENVINQHISEGIAEEAEFSGNGKEYFLPHHAVINEKKITTKLRVIFDGSSHAENCLSLNDCLESGPNLYPEILELLIKFRLHKIGITADIQSAFLQIALQPNDRNAVKFLWKDKNSEELKIMRMARVIFGAKPSPFLLGATIKFHIEKYKAQYPTACYLLDKFLYVDDLIVGTDTVNDAIEEAANINKILQEGSFNMRKWSTNEGYLQKLWQEREECMQGTTIKVLGYIWNKEKDILQIETPDLMMEQKSPNNKVTKRDVLKAIGRLYDPLGYLSPFAVKARILLQEIWKRGLQWDEALPQEFLVVWEKWKEELLEIKNVEISRHYFDYVEKEFIKNCQLHCFVDASEKAYGAVVYLKYEYKNIVQSRLICSKSRIAPLKKLTLPRLELMAAIIGARLSKTIQGYLKEHIKITPYYWSDSSIVLHWIKGSAEKWKPFVENRVREIQEKSEPAAWRYCPTKENPADLITRGSTIKDLKKNQIWWFGSPWLIKEEKLWPKLPLRCEEKEVQPERRKGKKTLQTSCIADRSPDSLFNLILFGSFSKVLRVTAWIKRYANYIKTKEIRKGPLTAEELEDSEIYWIKNTQKEFFGDELEALKNKKPLGKESKILMFNPFLDENQVIRVGGRLHFADLSFSEKHPMLISDKSYLADLIIKHNHEKMGHAGIAGTLAQIREKFWLLKGKQKVKTVLRKCIICQRFKSKPICQEIAPLPPDRVMKTFPFEITGIDFAGPLYTKNSDKTYIVLFTCAVTRALHLELINNLTTESFLLAFRKFLARRGLCKTVYTDNAQTFKRGAKELKKIWNTLKDPDVQEYFGKQGISWKFIVERAAWWGGFWERLVRSVKSCLKKILGRASLNFQELEAVLLEVEAMLNSRPLTYLYEDNTEPAPLSPAHFLIGRRMLTLPPTKKMKEMSSTKESLTRRFIHQQLVIERIWQRWKRAYLLELRSAHETKPPESTLSISEGSVVLVHDEKQPRLLWKMAIVKELHEGRDGKVRACSLKLPNGTITRRAVQHIYPLELNLEKTTPRLSGAEGVTADSENAPAEKSATRGEIIKSEARREEGRKRGLERGKPKCLT